MLLEHPTSSPAAFLIHVVTTGIIILSAVITVLETVPAFHSIPGSVWFGLETSLVALFSVEYIARCIAHSYSWTKLFKWMICELVQSIYLEWFLNTIASLLWYH